MRSLIELLANDGYIIVNKQLTKLLGLNEALIIGELISEYRYYSNRDELTDDGFFFSTIENIEENTSLNEYLQRKAMKRLVEMGILEIEHRKDKLRFFRINEKRLESILLGNNV